MRYQNTRLVFYLWFLAEFWSLPCHLVKICERTGTERPHRALRHVRNNSLLALPLNNHSPTPVRNLVNRSLVDLRDAS